jgi:hypothetical protein
MRKRCERGDYNLGGREAVTGEDGKVMSWRSKVVEASYEVATQEILRDLTSMQESDSRRTFTS